MNIVYDNEQVPLPIHKTYITLEYSNKPIDQVTQAKPQRLLHGYKTVKILVQVRLHNLHFVENKMVLEKYSDILSFIASSATIPLLLSPILICREFVKKGSSDHIKPIVFVGGLTRSVLFLQFGITTNLRPLIIIHSIGAILYTIYLCLYYKYCQNKDKVQNLFTKATAVVSILLGFVNFRTESLIAKYFGAIVTVVHLFLLAVPLLNLKNIMRTKSTHGMPFPIIFCANIVTGSWLLYGISVGNSTIILQMVIGFFLTGIQLSLFCIYPSTPPSEQKKDN